MAHDLVIRGGSVVDGTGSPPRSADVAIDGDRVVAVGEVDGPGRREINAEGCVVTPGFVDVHTHLDAQIGWDQLGTSSCWHGVTTVVMGNCGVTFAPVRDGDAPWLAEMMESVEDIPARTILDGLPWDWTTYGEYLASVDRLPKGINVGGMVGHCAVRRWAMGERSLDPDARPDDDELAAMVAAVDEALTAGALGFSSSRTLRHTVPDGRHVPGTFADGRELLAVADVLARHGRGVFEVAPRFDGEGDPTPRVESELAWMRDVALRSGQPLTFNLTQTREQGDHFRLALELAADVNADGGCIRPQTTPRGIGVLFGLPSGRTPWSRHPSWARLAEAPPADRLAIIRDPERRTELVDEARGRPPAERFADFFLVDGSRGARYDGLPEDSLAAIAERRGVTPAEAFLDAADATDGRAILNWPFLNQDLDLVAEMLGNPHVVLGLGDAGAHVGQIMDASQPTFLLSYWVGEQGLFPVEEAVRRLTSDTAGVFGIADRGVLRPGAFADVNVIDLDALRLPLPTYVHDFPHGAGRYVQRAEGYVATVVNGQVFMEDGEHTGALAGRVVRG